MITFLCYPKCTTCKKAALWLEKNKIKFSLRNIKENPPSEEEIREWHKKSGLLLKNFFNTSGLLYRSMDLKSRLPEASDEEKISLLASDGMLVKRPILIGEDFILVGFREAEWNKIL